MNRSESFLHVIGGKEVGHSCEFMKKSILKTKQWRWSNNCGFWKDFASNLFSECLALCQLEHFEADLTGQTFDLKNSDGELGSAL